MPPQSESLLTTMAQANRNLVSHRTLDLAPVVYVTAGRIQQSLPTRALTMLLDTGSSHTMIKLTSLPHGTSVTPSSPKRTTTTNGVFSSSAQVVLTDVRFPEFGNHRIDTITADVFDSPTCRYDVIVGRDILKTMGAERVQSCVIQKRRLDDFFFTYNCTCFLYYEYVRF